MSQFTSKYLAPSILSVIALLLPSTATAEFGAPVREVDIPAKSAVVAVCIFSLYSTGYTGNLQDVPCTMRDAQNQTMSTVPVGKMYVIEYVNFGCSTQENNPVIDIGFRTTLGANVWTNLPVTHVQPFGSSTRTTGSQPVRIYGGPNTTISGSVRRQSASPIQTYCDIRLWGHFVTLQP